MCVGLPYRDIAAIQDGCDWQRQVRSCHMPDLGLDAKLAAPLLERTSATIRRKIRSDRNKTAAINRRTTLFLNKLQSAKNETKNPGVNVRRKLGAHHIVNSR